LKTSARPQKSGRKLQLICQALMKQTIKILPLITVVMSCLPANGQQPAFQNFHKSFASWLPATKSSENKFLYNRLTPTQVPQTEFLHVSSQIIAADTYTRNFGFFCKEELQLQKRSGVNFSLRLGTLDQCNLLEGKTRTIVSR
jgi:hypothetical protein